MLKDTPLDTLSLISQSIFKCKKKIEEEYAELEREEELLRNENFKELKKNGPKNQFIDLDHEEFAFENLSRRFKGLEIPYQTINDETDDNYDDLIRRLAALEASQSFNVDIDENMNNLQAMQYPQKKSATTITETEEEKELRTRLDAIKRNYPPTSMNIDPDEYAIRTSVLRG